MLRTQNSLTSSYYLWQAVGLIEGSIVFRNREICVLKMVTVTRKLGMVLVDSEPIQSNQNRQEEKWIDIISHKLLPMWSLFQWWHTSLLFQNLNIGTVDLVRYFLGKHFVVLSRRNFDPCPHKKDLYSLFQD